MTPLEALPDRFREKIVVLPSGCWQWTSSITQNGYGQVWWEGKTRYAHRVVYELVAGPIPDGLHIDHLCRVPTCVNPEHLEPVTNRENILRGEGSSARRARQTHCKRGHEFTPENTLRHPRGGWRWCRTCQRACQRAYYKRKRSSADAATPLSADPPGDPS